MTYKKWCQFATHLKKRVKKWRHFATTSSFSLKKRCQFATILRIIDPIETRWHCQRPKTLGSGFPYALYNGRFLKETEPIFIQERLRLQTLPFSCFPAYSFFFRQVSNRTTSSVSRRWFCRVRQEARKNLLSVWMPTGSCRPQVSGLQLVVISPA